MSLRLSSFVSCSALSALTLSLAACGGSVEPTSPGEADAGADTTPADTGTVATDTGTPDTAPIDHGAPSETYPAFTPDLPMLVNKGGAVLTAPVVVTVTYPGDTNADSYEAFGDKLGASEYWKAITAEYGIGPTISGPSNHVREATTLPTAMTDGEIDTYVQEHAGNAAKYGWPAPTAQSIYVLYVPKTSKITLGGTEACAAGIGGYHTSTMVGDLEVAYAVVLQCSFGSKSGTPRTVTASHEIAEAATDPHPLGDKQGWVGVDLDHVGWHLFMAGNVENGDLCEVYRESRYGASEAEFAYNVQRQWSNANAKAGHNPCAPAPTSQPYFNVSALDQEKVTVNATAMGGAFKQATKGYRIAVGETKTFAVGFWSDAKMDSWTIGSTESTAFGSSATGSTAKRMTVSIDKKSGKNGEKAWVTVTVNSTPGNKTNLLTIVSQDGTGTQHYLPIVISSQ